MASSDVTSLKSKVKYGGKNGIGNLIEVNTKRNRAQRLIVIRLVYFVAYSVSPSIHLVRIGGLLLTKPPSSPIQTMHIV